MSTKTDKKTDKKTKSINQNTKPSKDNKSISKNIDVNNDSKYMEKKKNSEKLYQIIQDKSVNHIYFYNKYIDNKSVQSLRTQLSSYNNIIPGTMLNKNIRLWSTPTPIMLHIHCPGGEVDAGLAAMKLVYNSKIPIITVVDGLAASAATYMCMVSSLRMINPHGHMLIHQPTNNFPIKGKFQNIEDKYLRIKKYMKTLTQIYKNYTNLKDNTLKEILSQDIYMDANTCKKYGLVDKILE